MGNFNLPLEKFSHKKLHREVILLDYLKWDVLVQVFYHNTIQHKTKATFPIVLLVHQNLG